MKVSVYIATSLDGYIARKNGDLDWLPSGGGETEGEDYGYKDFIATVDYLVMGRHTFEKVLTFPGWQPEKPVVVLSSRGVEIPPALKGSVEVMSATPTELVASLSRRGAQHVYVDGGKTIQRFLHDGLIRRLIISRVPVLIGSGIPLFGALEHDIALHHVTTRHYANGLVQSEYTVADHAGSHEPKGSQA